MPRRPTSTPTPSPSRRTIKVMGDSRATTNHNDLAAVLRISSLVPRRTATFHSKSINIRNEWIFSFPQNLVYIDVFAVPSCRLEGLTVSGQDASRKTRISADFSPLGVRLQGGQLNPCPSTGDPNSSRAPSSK